MYLVREVECPVLEVPPQTSKSPVLTRDPDFGRVRVQYPRLARLDLPVKSGAEDVPIHLDSATTVVMYKNIIP